MKAVLSKAACGAATAGGGGDVEQLDGLRRDFSVDEDGIALGEHAGNGAEGTAGRR